MRLVRNKSIAALLPAAALILSGTVALGAAELHPRAVASAPLGILVFGRDSGDAARIVAAAGGRLVSSGGWLGTVVAVSDDPDFAARLYRAGASLVFRADGAVGCNGNAAARNFNEQA
jgi:hypothetical protein